MGNGQKVPSIKEEEMKKIFRRGVISNSKINLLTYFRSVIVLRQSLFLNVFCNISALEIIQ